jgi:pyridoxamine 5'-phosphate oxidase-like protein
MATWAEFESEARELAGEVRAAIERHKHLVLGTLRRDGSPRLSGTEVTFGLGELWLGMMPNGVKGRDLRRDPRFALHSAPLDVTMANGDAKLGGVAHEVVDQEMIDAYWELWGGQMMPIEALLFRLELRDASLATVDGDQMVVDAWRAGSAPWQMIPD